MNNQTLFKELYSARTEDEVDNVINSNPIIFKNENWVALGGDKNYFGIVRNQQSNPIAALVEKVTNSIDAILMKKCLEAGIDPQSNEAPRSMEEAIVKFFPDHKNWDLPTYRRKQAEEIQVVADGPPRNSSVIIYDNGEGQHPEDFESTFLSLVRGNKINIMFVQGKYNMGGSGALVFCGKKRYHLIGSKRFDNSGKFGFTLIRQHKVEASSESQTRASWFEYLKIYGKIPSFDSGEMDLNLFDRKFKTGTVIKLYSYQFPSGYAGFAQDLNQSLNEFLFDPLLPIYTVDKKWRYPNNKVLELDLYGLKRRLEEDKNDYVESFFSEEYEDQLFGKAKVTCYVFKPKLEKRDVKESKKIIGDRFFRNGMSVMFSVNGQVHGSYTSEFITRTLKFNLLKDYLLIHVDCTGMHLNFREELFMASRDRLKQGDESNELRDYLGKKLRKSQLDEINKRRKESIGLESEDTSELIKSFAKNLPKDSELFKLLQNTLKLEEKKEKKKGDSKRPTEPKEAKPFNAQRFPSKFELYKRKDGVNVITLPINGEKTIRFETDVANDYFDRVEDAGELSLALLKVKHNERGGGDKPGEQKEISDLLNVVKSSPNEGIIKLTLNPTENLQVDDEIEIKASLTAAGDPLEEIVAVKIVEPEKPKEKTPKEEESLETIGLPELIKVEQKDWERLQQSSIQMDYETVMYPVASGDTLERIYVNVDSNVFLKHRAKLKSEDQILTAQKRYITSVYFHTLFLYMITKKRGYNLSLQKEGGKTEDVSIDEYLCDVFDSYYSDFLLNFGMEQLMGILEE